MSGASSGHESNPARGEIASAARSHGLDRYLAALLAPRSSRDALVTLAAFAGEMERIPTLVSDPLLAEIRLQWWRDAILGTAPDQRTGNPLADSVLGLVRQHQVPAVWLQELFDARSGEIRLEVGPAEAASSDQCDAGAEASAFKIAAHILKAPLDHESSAIVAHAARSYDLVRMLIRLPGFLAHGRIPPELGKHGIAIGDSYGAELPPKFATVLANLRAKAREHLVSARRNLKSANPALVAALLPVALVEPYLQALETEDFDPRRDIAEIAPLTRVWRLWRAHRNACF